jgi:hypothetical protein
MGRPVVVDIPGATVVDDEAARNDGDLFTSYGWRLLARRAPGVPDTTVTGWRIVARWRPGCCPAFDVVRCAAMEHHHRCVYCATVWFCHEDCVLSGASACEDCREKLRMSPEMQRRVVDLRDRRVMDRLIEHASENIRKLLRRDRPH